MVCVCFFVLFCFYHTMSCPAILLEMVSFLNMVCMHGERFESVKYVFKLLNLV